MKIKKSTGAILVKNKKPLVIDTFYFPDRLYKGQVLIELIYSGVCGSQLGEIDGVKGKDNYLPHLLGHEGVGYVIDKHKSVKKVKIGDKVMMHWMPSVGIDARNPIYQWNNKKLNAGKITTFNNHAILSENRITRVKKRSHDLNNLMLGCTASTALGSVLKIANVKKTNKIAVSGCGILGLFIIKVLSFLEIKNIVAVDINEKKLLKAKKFGARYILNPKTKNIEKNINNIFGGVDYFFECSGNISIINDAFKTLNNSGTQVFIGVPPHNKKAQFNTLDINLGKKLIGSKGGGFIPDQEYYKYEKLTSFKKLNYHNFITERIRLKDINDLIMEMKKGKIIGKPIIQF